MTPQRGARSRWTSSPLTCHAWFGFAARISVTMLPARLPVSSFSRPSTSRKSPSPLAPGTGVGALRLSTASRWRNTIVSCAGSAVTPGSAVKAGTSIRPGRYAMASNDSRRMHHASAISARHEIVAAGIACVSVSNTAFGVSPILVGVWRPRR